MRGKTELLYQLMLELSELLDTPLHLSKIHGGGSRIEKYENGMTVDVLKTGYTREYILVETMVDVISSQKLLKRNGGEGVL